MVFTIHPTEATSSKNPYRQWLGRAPGCPVPASEVKVYRRKKNGQPGKRTIRIEDKNGHRIEGDVSCQKVK